MRASKLCADLDHMHYSELREERKRLSETIMYGDPTPRDAHRYAEVLKQMGFIEMYKTNAKKV